LEANTNKFEPLTISAESGAGGNPLFINSQVIPASVEREILPGVIVKSLLLLETIE
jgi:hypothetical protein